MKLSKLLFVGILSVLVFGVCSNVDAASTVTDQLPDGAIRSRDVNSLYFTQGEGNYIIRGFSRDNKYLLYDIGFNNPDTFDGLFLIKDKRLDYGVAYILKNAYPTRQLVSGVSGDSTTPELESICNDNANEMVNIFITQNALWYYLGKIDSVYSDNMLFTNDAHRTAACDKYIYNGTTYASIPTASDHKTTTDFSKLLWDTYVVKLVNEAKAVKDPAESTLTFSTDNKWNLEGDHYKSDAIHLNFANGTSDSANIALSLENAPAGTRVYSGNNDITDNLSNVTNTAEGMYITVPTSEVKNGSASFSLNAKATIKYDAAYKYLDKSGYGHQSSSVLVGPESKDISGTLNLTIVPDTASIISKSIYFIGFIILLSGAGLIYANIKPRNQE